MKPLLMLTRYLAPLMRIGWVKRKQIERIRAGEAGPSADELKNGKSFVWGRVENDAGVAVEARSVGPNGYMLTAHTALLIAKRVLAGDVTPGFVTPSLAYGADLILEVPGVQRSATTRS